MKNIIVLFFALACLSGCYINGTPETIPASVSGFRPIYASYESVRNVQTTAPRPLQKPGKIYVKDQYLFICELGEGLHVIDNSDPAKPLPLSFIVIKGNQDLAVKDSTLYADNFGDLVALNIGNPRNVKVLKRIENAFPYLNSLTNNQRGWFECPDPAKGVIIGWQQVQLTQPKCYR